MSFCFVVFVVLSHSHTSPRVIYLLLALGIILRWINFVSQHIFRSASLKVIDRNWREEALIFSRQHSCNYALITDSDCFILPDTLKRLIDLNLVVVSPLLNAPFGRHSNVDGLLEDDFVFRKEEYIGNKRVNNS